MKQPLLSRVALGALACVTLAAQAQTGQPTIHDYLYTLGTGPTAAHEIIQLDGSAVMNLQAGKDLVLALGALGDPAKKDGFGIAFTPGRSRIQATAVSLARYADGSDWAARLWGNTTFSYAQNRVSLAGSDYAQRAFAVNVSMVLKHEEDPIVAARDAVRRDIAAKGPCLEALTDLQGYNGAVLRRLGELRARAGFAQGVEVDAQTLAKLQQEADRITAEGLADELPAVLRESRRGRSAAAAAAPASRVRPLGEIAGDLNTCSQAAAYKAEEKWNASQLTLVLGKGSIEPVAGGSRMSLGTHAAVALAYGVGDNGLLNLTLRRIRRELDTGTIGTTPDYRNTSIAALRYTYGMAGRDTYALAEASNVKKNSLTTSSSAFKHAVGIDHKVSGGLWLEFRYGLARTADGTKLENKALFNLKFSPESTLDREAGGG